MSQDTVEQQIRERHTFRVDDEWTQRDEKDKQDLFNQVFENQELKLIKTREAINQLDSPFERDADVVGWLYYFAFEIINDAANTAKTQNREANAEKFDSLADEFLATLPDGMTPYNMKQLSKQSQKIGRTPARLRRVMEDRGEKIIQLISFAYSGTEAVTEGTSDEETPSLSDEEQL